MSALLLASEAGKTAADKMEQLAKLWETMAVADAAEFVPHCRAAKL